MSALVDELRSAELYRTLCREAADRIEVLETSLAETQLLACGDWCSENRHTPECARARALLSSTPARLALESEPEAETNQGEI